MLQNEGVYNSKRMRPALNSHALFCRYSVMFSETLNVDYVSAAWREFEMSLGPLAREAVESVCDRLTTDKVPAEENLENAKDGTSTADLSTGTRDVAQCTIV